MLSARHLLCLPAVPASCVSSAVSLPSYKRNSLTITFSLPCTNCFSRQVGWFPEYTITEDYALSMELKSAGFKGRYLSEYLAVGEAPDEIRNVCRQRSRWTKGHMQIFFSRRCPLFNWKLPFIHKLLYTNGTWA